MQVRSYGRSYAPFEPLLEVVRRENRLLGDLAQALAAERADVRVRTHEDAEVAVEAADPTNDCARATRVRRRRRRR